MIGEFGLAAILYVQCREDDSELEQLDRCFPEIYDVSYRDKFADLVGSDGFTRLSSGVFWWLINI